ncbi:MAG: DUF1761 domain-containing protein [Nanoarchaeota archaeon]
MAPPVDINFVAILIASIVSFVLGAVWYSPGLFGNIWARLSGMSEKGMKKNKQKGMVKLYIINFIFTLVMAYVLSHVIGWAQDVDFTGGAATGFGMWAGFILPLLVGSLLWEKKSMWLFIINAGYWLVSLVFMGGIIALWA